MEEVGEFTTVRPTLKELYLVLFDGEDAFLGEIISFDQEDTQVVYLKNKKTSKEYPLLLDGETLLHTTDSYKILDIERVIPFDLDILTKDPIQSQKMLTEDIIQDSDIGLNEIKESEKVYTQIELREDIISSLIHSFDAYDNYQVIQSLTDCVDSIVDLVNVEEEMMYLYNVKQNALLPKWITPIVDNPLTIYRDVDTLVDFIDSRRVGGISFNDSIQSALNDQRAVESSLSETGFYTTNVRKYYRNCLTSDSCMSFYGNYQYDMRNNKKDNILIFDGDKNVYHTADNLNIVGLLYIPNNLLYHTLDIHIDLLTMGEKSLLNKIKGYNSYNPIKRHPIFTKRMGEFEELTDLDQVIQYTIPNRIDKVDFDASIREITPSIQQLMDSMPEALSTKLLNYKDFRTTYIQYNINPYKLVSDDITLINKLIEKNVTNYIETTPTLHKINVKNYQSILTTKQKIQTALDIILSMVNISVRNEYLKKFMDQYCRNPQANEDPSWLYNVYTDEKILCRHYQLQSIYHTDRSAFETMITVYGKYPEDGVIHCKNCGEYLCNEDYSEFDGFRDEQPIMMREVMEKDVNLLDNFKEADILLVQQLATVIGVKLRDEDVEHILEVYKSFNSDLLAEERYKQQNITSKHPFIKTLKKKHSKAPKKEQKKLIANDVKAFQSYLRDTNKMISLMAVVILVIHTSVPAYKQTSKTVLLEFNNEDVSYNIKYLDYYIHKVSKLIRLYPDDKIWSHLSQLLGEAKQYGTPTCSAQVMNLLHYVVSPLYPKLQDRVNTYKTFIYSSNQVYVNYEWSLFKPLEKSLLSSNVNNFLIEQDSKFKEYYILDYNSHPVENISLIRPLTSKDEGVHTQLGLDVSEILVNQSFLRLLSLSISNYGVYKGRSDIIDLHTDRFLETIDRKREVEAIFKKHGWGSSLVSGSISFKKLRNKIIPEIVKLYLNNTTELMPCYEDESLCNQFIHIYVNNYDLHMVKTESKRIYNYIPFTVFPTGKFDSMSDDFKDKLFKRYCKDPSGKIIKRFLTPSYLGKYLLHLDKDLEEDPSNIYEQPLTGDSASFKEILQAIQSHLPEYLYVKPSIVDLERFTESMHYKKQIEQRILQQLEANKYYGMNKDHEIVVNLTKLLAEDNSNPGLVKRELNRSFSLLDYTPYVEGWSTFIANYRDKKMIQRFESIFINTTTNINISSEEREQLQGDGFRYRNVRESDVSKIFDVFLTNRLNVKDCKMYLYSIRTVLSKLSNAYRPPTAVTSTWKLTKHYTGVFSEYLDTNSLLLHRDLFNRNPKHRGFMAYDKKPLFSCLYTYISDYLGDLDQFTIHTSQYLSPELELMLMKYILMFTLYKLVEFTMKIKDGETGDELLSTVESKFIEMGEEFNRYDTVEILERFLMDIIVNMLETHYDSNWLSSNRNVEDLSQRLSKQKEKEKQQLIQNLDTMSDEKRASTVELQNIGVLSMYHQAMASNESRIIDEYSTFDEGDDLIDNKEVVDAAVSVSTGEIVESAQPSVEIPQTDEGYYNNEDFDEDGVMGDEMQEFTHEDLLDNEFNV